MFGLPTRGIFLQVLPIPGMMLYELHLPNVMLANRALQRGPGNANPAEIKEQLKVKTNWRECGSASTFWNSPEYFRRVCSICEWDWKSYGTSRRVRSSARLLTARKNPWSNWNNGWKRSARIWSERRKRFVLKGFPVFISTLWHIFTINNTTLFGNYGAWLCPATCDVPLTPLRRKSRVDQLCEYF